MSSVLIVGSGLMGTSLGLALSSAGWTVYLDDPHEGNLSEAVARGAGARWTKPSLDGSVGSAGRPTSMRLDLAVASCPPSDIASVLARLQQLGVAQTYTHLSSVQSQVQRQVQALGCDLSEIVGSHPLAGRETVGPAGATRDLFRGRPWAVCPSAASSKDALASVEALVVACGGIPVRTDAPMHDRSVALLSHAPQIMSSALAATLLPWTTPTEHERPGEDAHRAEVRPTDPTPDAGVLVSLSGPGLADTTRLAASSPELWTDILTTNAEQVAPVVRALVEELTVVMEALDAIVASADGGSHEGSRNVTAEPARGRATLRSFLQRGNRGRATVQVKRGVPDAGFARVSVEVDDRPGRLAALLADAGAAGVNVEDVRVEHVPGRATGVITLLVTREARPGLTGALAQVGWRVETPDERGNDS